VRVSPGGKLEIGTNAEVHGVVSAGTATVYVLEIYNA
jgi:hypothetical protein